METWRDFTLQTLVRGIKEACMERISSLIVIVASHGLNGVIEADDGHIPINTLIDLMSQLSNGIPKVKAYIRLMSYISR